MIRLIKSISYTLNKDATILLNAIGSIDSNQTFYYGYSGDNETIKNIVLACIKPCFIIKVLKEEQQELNNSQELKTVYKQFNFKTNTNNFTNLNELKFKQHKAYNYTITKRYKDYIKDFDKIGSIQFMLKDKSFFVLHASTKDKSKYQLSYFINQNNNIIPFSDKQFNNIFDSDIIIRTKNFRSISTN